MATLTSPHAPLQVSPDPKSTGSVDKEHRAALRAGIFLAITLSVGIIVIILLGSEHRMFEKSSMYTVHFPDVDGLKLDSPVRLGGLDVGRVKEITFSPELGDTRVQVRFDVADKYTGRIRSDSVARVASRGLLGDKTVDISLGSAEGKAVLSGGELEAGTGGDITSVLKAGSEVVDNVVAISTDVRKMVSAYSDPALRDELTGAVTDVRGILSEVARGKGALHAVIYDPQTGDDLKSLLNGAQKTAHRLDSAVARVDAMLGQVEHGDGAAHALLYGPEGKKALLELSSAAGEVGNLLRDVKGSKNAAVHQLLYGDSRALVDDLTTSAKSLKGITAKIESGEGSLGALVNDPTAYEDLKTILGNVKRNRLLRELVRFSISNRSEFEDTGKPLTPPVPEAHR
jgi:phospholipid/cholesterol/gamma-HCH transport system substrate-binding protein